MAEGDIIDPEEVDRDTVAPDLLGQQFNEKYKLLTEAAVSLKKTYVKKLHATKSQKIAVGLADNSIKVYALNNTSLNGVCRFSGHIKPLTDLVFSPKEDTLIYSSGLDGIIKLWDTRSGLTWVQEYKVKPVIKVPEPLDPESQDRIVWCEVQNGENQLKKQYECMDVSYNGRMLCAGTQLAHDDAYLVFWDNRKVNPLGGYWNSHTDDITQVKFHKQKSEIIASGSLDGLLNIYNILEPKEEDALTYSLNVENSVEKICWLNENLAATITQSNDVQVWDVDKGDQVNSFSRDKVARSIKRSKGDDCYLVDMFTTRNDTQVILAGSYGGNGDVLRSVAVSGQRLQPHTNYKQNTQTVRCCWYDNQSEILFTSGESGHLSVWSPSETEEPEYVYCAGRLVSSLHKLHVHRHRPY